jgi:cell wall-associated NlpC family hydrolase
MHFIPLLSLAALAAATPLSPARVFERVAASPSPNPNPTGEAVVQAAASQEGQPYVYGGGGCGGPTNGGYDCSGLTQYALCQGAHVSIPRTSKAQYASSLGQHIPRAQAKPGDLLFWATNGDCANSVVHVGVFMSPGQMIDAPHTGTTVRQQGIWTSSGGESICPDAVR